MAHSDPQSEPLFTREEAAQFADDALTFARDHGAAYNTPCAFTLGFAKAVKMDTQSALWTVQAMRAHYTPELRQQGLGYLAL